MPAYMASNSDVVNHYKRKFYQLYIDPDLIVEPMSTSSSQSDSNPTPLDQQAIHLSVNDWVFVIAMLSVIPLLPWSSLLSAYQLCFLGTVCSSLYSLYLQYGKPTAWDLQALRIYLQPILGTEDLIFLIICSISFVISHLCLIFSVVVALIPILCRPLEHIAKFLRRNFSGSTLYRKYIEEACVWVESNTTYPNILTSYAEIGFGFLLIISLLSWQRIFLTFMYWKVLKLMYQSPVTAPYHQSAWATIGRILTGHASWLNTPLRWWLKDTKTN